MRLRRENYFQEFNFSVCFLLEKSAPAAIGYQFLSFVEANTQFLSWPDHPPTPGWVWSSPSKDFEDFGDFDFLAVLAKNSRFFRAPAARYLEIILYITCTPPMPIRRRARYLYVI